MTFSAWSENDPAGSDAASSINEAATRAAVRVRERLATVFPDWTTATERIHQEKIFINSNGLTIRDDTDAATLGSISSGGFFSLNTQPRCRLRKATPFTISNGSFTSVPFNVEDIDVGPLHDAINLSRITIPTGAGGLYLFMFQSIVQIPYTSGTYALQSKILKNGGSDEIVFPTMTNAIQVSNQVILEFPIVLNTLIAASAGDYYEIQFNANWSSPSIVPHLSVAKLF